MVEEAIKNFILPEEFKQFEIRSSGRKNKKTQSALYSYGVIAEQSNDMIFFCLAHSSCREQNTCINLRGG